MLRVKTRVRMQVTSSAMLTTTMVARVLSCASSRALAPDCSARSIIRRCSSPVDFNNTSAAGAEILLMNLTRSSWLAVRPSASNCSTCPVNVLTLALTISKRCCSSGP
ncbi:hypothetical protein D3C80_1717930 [compost metagenome]